MKTARQWLEEMKARPCVTEADLLTIIGQIQNDAREHEKLETRAWLSQALDEGGGVYKP